MSLRLNRRYFLGTAAATAAAAEEAVARVRAAYAIGAERPSDPPLIAGRVG